MGFRENLLKKIKINALAQSVLLAMGPPESGRRIDTDEMRRLIEMGSYDHRRERDLDIYFLNDADSKPLILVLDNELKVYRTSVEDVALRKSPTVKEMISIRNAIKILNDKDVVVCRKADTVERIRMELIQTLDLSWGPDDIQALVDDGIAALKNNYTDGLIEIAILFAELIGYQKAPTSFQANHYHIWGMLEKGGSGDMIFGPALLLNLMHNELKIIRGPVNSSDKAAMKLYKEILKGTSDADVKGKEVLTALQQTVMENLA